MRASKLKSLKLLIFCHLDAILDNHNGDLFRHFQCGKVVVKFEACRVCLDLEGKKKIKILAQCSETEVGRYIRSFTAVLLCSHVIKNTPALSNQVKTEP